MVRTKWGTPRAPTLRPVVANEFKLQSQSDDQFSSQDETYHIHNNTSLSETPSYSIIHCEEIPSVGQRQRSCYMDDACEWVIGFLKRICWIPAGTPRPNQPQLVGRCQHLFWDRCNNWDLLGGMDMDPLFLSWPFIGFQHRLGGGRCCGVRSSPSIVPELTPSSIWSTLPGQIRQRRGSRVDFKRKVLDRRIQQRPEEHPSLTHRSSNFNQNDTYSKSLQCPGHVVLGQHSLFPEQFSKGFNTNHSSTPSHLMLKLRCL